MKKIALVTGAEGFIGSHLVKFLAANGWQVVGTHLPHSVPANSKSRGVTLVHCDLRNGQRLARIIQETSPTHLFHLGAQSLPTVSWQDPVGTFESNIMGSLYLFEAVRAMKRPPIVVSACSSAEYGNVRASAIPVVEDQPLRPLHPYGISKVVLDMLGREYFLDHGIHAVNLRLFNTTGPGKTSDAPSDFVRQIVRIKKGLQEPILRVGNLRPRRAFLDVNDTVRAFYLAAMKGKGGESYNVCATKTFEVGEMLHKALKIAGVKAEIQEAEHLLRPSDEKIIFGSTSKLRKDTGWKPKYSLDQTLASMIDYWDRVL